MTATVAPGQALTLQATYGLDATTLEFSVANGAGSVVFGPVTAGISHIGTGVYLFTWAVPAEQDAGTYTAIWTATFGTAPNVTTESITVSPLSGSCWCALSDITALTGQPTPSQSSLTAAQSMLEALIHRVWRPTDVERRDYYWLARAVAWQAVYLEAHPELVTMMDVASISQDGLSITFKGGTGAVQLYSATARRFLDALYRGSNTTIRLNSTFQKNRPLRQGFDPGAAVSWTRL
jgi:hypothetical protein